jgi:hypothetical protein
MADVDGYLFKHTTTVDGDYGSGKEMGRSGYWEVFGRRRSSESVWESFFSWDGEEE